MTGEQAQRVTVMSNADGQKAQIFMTGVINHNQTPRKHSSETTEVVLDWKLAKGTPAKAFVGNKESVIPESLAKRFQILPQVSSSAYLLTKHVVSNQIEFAKYNINQIQDAISEVKRLIEDGKVKLKSQALSQLQDIQQNSSAILTKIEETTSEMFPIASVMDFVGRVDDFIKSMLNSTTLESAKADLQKFVVYPLTVARKSSAEVRKALIAAKESASSILSTERIKMTLNKSITNLQVKLNLLKQIFEEKVKRFRTTQENPIGDAHVSKDNQEDDKYANIVKKIEVIVEGLKNNMFTAFTIDSADKLRSALWDLFGSLEDLRLKTRDIQDKKTTELIRNVKEISELALTLLQTQGKNFIDLLKTKTKQQLSGIDTKLKEKATKVAAATQAKVKSLNADYDISGKIHQSRTQADTFLKSWGIDVNGLVSKLLETANVYDDKFAGGRGKHLLQKARDTAENVQSAINSVSQTDTEE